VVALTGQNQIDKLAEQCRQFRPRYAVVLDADKAAALEKLLAGNGHEVLVGVEALEARLRPARGGQRHGRHRRRRRLAPRPGRRARPASGCCWRTRKPWSWPAASSWKRSREHGGATLLPIDSEHNAVFQSMPSGYNGKPESHGVRRILLTASGGPFRTRELDTLARTSRRKKPWPIPTGSWAKRSRWIPPP
jgi:1-deoxy-D-xylulose-5-phosphate reductoisomerase